MTRPDRGPDPDVRRPLLARLRPAAPRGVLLVLAGVLWTAVGGMLVFLALRWIRGAWGLRTAAAGLLGAGTALLAGSTLFRRIARRNIERILHRPEWACVFSFQAFRSWLLVGVMVALGALLRASALPRAVLAYVYLSVGGALLLASLSYHRFLLRSRPLKAPPP